MTVVVNALLLLGGCSDDVGPGECSASEREVRAESSFDVVAFGHDFSPFCAASFAAAEDHVQWVADAWEEEPIEFTYELFESRDDSCWPCSELASNALACAFTDSMSATQLPHRHELAHVVRADACSPLLEEGWAMLYGDHFDEAPTVGDLHEAADSIESGLLAGDLYPLAARFVAFLLETRGLDAVKALCEVQTGSAELLDDGLTQVLGRSLDEIALEFDDYPEWSLGELRQDQACEGKESTDSPGSWSFDLECGAPGVEGRGDGQRFAHHLVNLPQQGNYVFRAQAAVEFSVRLELRNCTRDGMASTHYQIEYAHGGPGDPYELLLDFPAGVYVVRVLHEDSPEPLILQMSVEPWP